MSEIGWKCPLTGDVYPQDDPRLIGRSMPPTTPGAPGMGTCQMQQAVITDAEAKAARDECEKAPYNYNFKTGQADVMPRFGQDYEEKALAAAGP